MIVQQIRAAIIKLENTAKARGEHILVLQRQLDKEIETIDLLHLMDADMAADPDRHKALQLLVDGLRTAGVM